MLVFTGCSAVTASLRYIRSPQRKALNPDSQLPDKRKKCRTKKAALLCGRPVGGRDMR